MYTGDLDFVPMDGVMVYTPDTDWLAVGVWITVPDDMREGDYAIGAYAYGNQPFTDPLNAVIGKATYEGQAFGRYAEDMNGSSEVGRFTADAVLTADFGDTTDSGTIFGTLMGFMAGDVAKDGWDLNLQSADLMQETGDNMAAHFNGGVSGHSGGHNLDGVWNGQFYGNDSTAAINAALAAATTAAAEDDELAVGPGLTQEQITAMQTANDERVTQLAATQGQPGSVAGTFAATDRDTTDSYGLTLGGAFAAENQVPEAE